MSSKITYKPAPSIGFNEDKLACFVERPPDMSPDQYETAKNHAEKVGARMPQQMSDSAFYFYYMGAGWEEISNKLNIPIGMLLYTAVYYKWFDRKKLVNSVRAGEKVNRADAAAIDLVTDAVVATAAIYKLQLAEVIKNPANAKDCALVPKNFKELQILLQLMESLQTKAGEGGSKLGQPIVNVNVANLSGSGEKQKTFVETNVTDAQLLEESTDDADRLAVLKILERVKNK